jgi:dethiobiotin synthetase
LSIKTRFILVTGTDTGVGKTMVACALARSLADQGQRVCAIKPVETGCGASPGPREDGVQLARATGQVQPRMALCRLRAPLAAPQAAEAEGGSLNYENLLNLILELAKDQHVVLLEGAGGVLSPLTWQHTVIDLARDLSAQVVLVAADRLGTLSATRAACRVLSNEGFEPRAVVLNQVHPEAVPASEMPAGCAAPPVDASVGLNGLALAHFPEVPAVFPLAHLSGLSAAARAMAPLARRLLNPKK